MKQSVFGETKKICNTRYENKEKHNKSVEYEEIAKHKKQVDEKWTAKSWWIRIRS